MGLHIPLPESQRHVALWDVQLELSFGPQKLSKDSQKPAPVLFHIHPGAAVQMLEDEFAPQFREE